MPEYAKALTNAARMLILSEYFIAEVAQLVERRLAKAKVAGSNPVFRSIFFQNILMSLISKLIYF